MWLASWSLPMLLWHWIGVWATEQRQEQGDYVSPSCSKFPIIESRAVKSKHQKGKLTWKFTGKCQQKKKLKKRNTFIQVLLFNFYFNLKFYSKEFDQDKMLFSDTCNA